GTERRPRLKLRPCGPLISISVIVREPKPSSSLRRLVGLSTRSWVAQVVESAAMTSNGGEKSTGVACWATWAPTSSGHRPSTLPMSSEDDQPRSEMSEPSTVDTDFGRSEERRVGKEGRGAGAG